MRAIDGDYVLKALNIFNCSRANKHFVNGIKTAEEIVKDAPSTEAWVDVSDRLPLVGDSVIFVTRHYKVRGGNYLEVTAYRDKRGRKNPTFVSDGGQCYFVNDCEVRYWMPMPEIPEKEISFLATIVR